MDTLTIGRLARRAGVGIQTVRFYERRGLIDEPPRGASGYRQYPAHSVTRLRFILRAKELGFTLKEINELLGLQLRSSRPCPAVRERIAGKIQTIESKIQDLAKIQRALTRLTACCAAAEPEEGCPFLAALAAEERN